MVMGSQLGILVQIRGLNLVECAVHERTEMGSQLGHQKHTILLQLSGLNGNAHLGGCAG